jgi:hypothetical protein
MFILRCPNNNNGQLVSGGTLTVLSQWLIFITQNVNCLNCRRFTASREINGEQARICVEPQHTYRTAIRCLSFRTCVTLYQQTHVCNVERDGKFTVNGEFERVRKDVVVVYLTVMSQNSLGKTVVQLIGPPAAFSVNRMLGTVHSADSNWTRNGQTHLWVSNCPRWTLRECSVGSRPIVQQCSGRSLWLNLQLRLAVKTQFPLSVDKNCTKIFPLQTSSSCDYFCLSHPSIRTTWEADRLKLQGV